MLITADWVLPVSEPPIRHGAVAVREGRVVEVGPAADLASRWMDDPVESLDGCIVAPGLVNAHTHLALSVLGGMLPPGPLHPWLRPITRAILGLSHDEFGVSSAVGALECLLHGTTVAGDISYGAETPVACEQTGLAGVFFWEVLGLHPHELDDSLSRRGYPLTPEAGPPGAVDDLRIRPGLSPHAPYSSGPQLLRETSRRARSAGVPLAIHVAESAEEVELFRDGEGPFVAQAERLAHGFEAPAASPVEYLASLGVLDDALCVHAVHVSAGDMRLLADRARGVVLCPRSNRYLENGDPPVAALRAAGVRLALGTDSSASNADLNLFAEACALRALDPTIPADELLRMVTLSGAELLGVADAFGSLREGAQADLVAVRTSAGGADRKGGEAHVGDAEGAADAFLRAGAAGGVEAVMSAGVWRVRDCAPTADHSDLERAAALVREHAAALVASA